MLKQAGRPPLRQGSEMLKQARRLVPDKIEEADGFFVVELGQAGHDGFLLRLEHTCPCSREERALNFGRNSGLLQSRRPSGPDRGRQMTISVPFTDQAPAICGLCYAMRPGRP